MGLESAGFAAQDHQTQAACKPSSKAAAAAAATFFKTLHLHKQEITVLFQHSGARLPGLPGTFKRGEVTTGCTRRLLRQACIILSQAPYYT